MATNIIFEDGDQFGVAATHPATPKSNDPIHVGQLPGVALTDERADGNVSAKFNGVAKLSVKGIDGAGNSAVAPGDTLFYVDADTPVLSKKNTGVRYGYALEAVAGGATATIRVKIGY